MWCHGCGCTRLTVNHGLRPATTNSRFSSRKTAIRRATRSVRFFALVICLEMVGLLSPQSIGVGLEDVSLGFFCLLVEQDRLRALLHNRYLRRGRCRLPKSRQWREVVLDALPDDQWRRFTRVDRGTYAMLAELLEPHLPRQRRRGRPRISSDTIMKVGLYRLGHYGNGASTVIVQCFYIVGRVPCGGAQSCGYVPPACPPLFLILIFFPTFFHAWFFFSRSC